MRVAAVFCGLVFLTGCASIPDVEYSYLPSKMTAVATATQTVSCSPDLQSHFILNTATLSQPIYSADLQSVPRRISIRRIEGTFASFADSDVSFQFYDDGRLKGINQNTIGEGETIIKSVVSFGTTAANFAKTATFLESDAKAKTEGQTPPPPPPPSKVCSVVAAWAGQGGQQLKDKALESQILGEQTAAPSQPKGPISVSLTYGGTHVVQRG